MWRRRLVASGGQEIAHRGGACHHLIDRQLGHPPGVPLGWTMGLAEGIDYQREETPQNHPAEDRPIYIRAAVYYTHVLGVNTCTAQNLEDAYIFQARLASLSCSRSRRAMHLESARSLYSICLRLRHETLDTTRLLPPRPRRAKAAEPRSCTACTARLDPFSDAHWALFLLEGAQKGVVSP
jgi:hypothetical protein